MPLTTDIRKETIEVLQEGIKTARKFDSTWDGHAVEKMLTETYKTFDKFGLSEAEQMWIELEAFHGI